MDENMSEEERPESPMGHENAKRMRTDFDPEDSSESSNTSENNSNNECNEQTASTSSDSGLPTSNEVYNDQVVENGSFNGESEERTGEDQDSDSDDSDSVLSGRDSRSSSEGTIIRSTDTDTDGEDSIVTQLLNKEKPKHSWFVVPEVMNRQLGYTAKRANPSLFQHRCYGSLRNVQKLELMYKLEEHDGCVNALNFSPDGTWLASGSDDLKLVLWDWRLGKRFLKIDTKHKKNIFQTKFLDLKGPDLHLLSSGRDGQVLYSQVSQEGLRDCRKIGQHRGPCHKLSPLKDQPHIFLSAGEDGIVFSHDVRRNNPERLIYVKENEEEVPLYSIHPHPLNTNEFCLAGREACVRVYDARKSSLPLAIYSPYRTHDPRYRRLHITCAVYNHDGSEILASFNDDDVYIFETENPLLGFCAQRFSGHKNEATIKGVAFFGPRSEFVMTGSDCGHVFFWERKTEAIAQFLLADDNGVVNCLEPHPTLPFLATSGLDWDVKIWVPSCEDEVKLNGLETTVRENKRNTWGLDPDGNESQSLEQVLRLLWHRLRSSRLARSEFPDVDFEYLTDGRIRNRNSDSSSDSWQSSNDDDDLGDDAPGCTTS